MFKSVKARVVLVLVAVLVLSTAAVPAASAGTLTAPTESQLSANSAGAWGCSQQYVVHRGDTLSRIAYRFGTTVNALMRCNNIWDPDVIYWGQVLCICGGYNPPPPPPPPPPKPPKPPKCPQPCQAPCQAPCQRCRHRRHRHHRHASRAALHPRLVGLRGGNAATALISGR
jgi:hypothetical protein